MRKMKAMVGIMMAAMVAMAARVAPLHASTMDDRIESSARESYIFKTYLTGDDIKIQSKDGAVTLTGTVFEESHKTLASETVEGLPGTKSVDNKLEYKGSMSAANSDAWIKEKVKFTLMFHRKTNTIDRKISVQDGIVTLAGAAENIAQKDLAAVYVKDVEGVKSVVNELTVSNTAKKTHKKAIEKIDDASITAQVKIMLLFHSSTSLHNTKVKTDNGAVTLSGKATNAAEKDLATKFVEDIRGVKSVKNELSVE